MCSPNHCPTPYPFLTSRALFRPTRHNPSQTFLTTGAYPVRRNNSDLRVRHNYHTITQSQFQLSFFSPSHTMNPFTLLRADMLTFLSYLQAHPCKIIGARFLATANLVALNALLTKRTPTLLNPTKNARGEFQRGAITKLRERDLPRLCLLHALAEAARLIAYHQRQIILTPHAARWVESDSTTQANLLLQALLPARPTDAHLQLWRAFHLPGYHLNTPWRLITPLLEIIHAAPDQTLRFTTFLKMIPLPTFDDDAPAHAPETVLREMLNLLQTLGQLTWQSRATIQIHRVPALDTPTKPNPLVWSKTKTDAAPTLIADETTQPRALFQLSKYANHLTTLVTTRSLRRLYALDPEKIRRALDQGATLADLQLFLETITAAELPPRVHHWLDAIGEKYGAYALRHVILLESDDPQKISALAQAKTIRACFQRPLSPRAIIIRPDRAQHLIRRLQHRGIFPRIEIPINSQQSTVSILQSPVSNLYFALQLTRQLAARHLINYSLPYSILETLTQTIPAAEMEQLDAQIQDILNASPLFQDPQKNRAATPFVTAQSHPVPASLVSKHLAQIQNALQTQTALTITYYSPYTDETTIRVIEPHLLETRRHNDYLIGYCHRDHAERTFRIDRILEIMSEEKNARAARNAVSR